MFVDMLYVLVVVDIEYGDDDVQGKSYDFCLDLFCSVYCYYDDDVCVQYQCKCQLFEYLRYFVRYGLLIFFI